MATQMLVFQSKGNVLFMMFDLWMCAHVCVYLHISVCMWAHLQVCTSVFVWGVCMYLYGFMCV